MQSKLLVWGDSRAGYHNNILRFCKQKVCGWVAVVRIEHSAQGGRALRT